MGHYTLVAMDVPLRAKTPDVVRRILRGMIDGSATWDEREKRVRGLDPLDIPPHPFFSCDRWDVLARMGSTYFDEPTCSSLEGDRLRVQANLKNYAGEIDLFADWVGRYVDRDGLPTVRIGDGHWGFAGLSRPEGWDGVSRPILWHGGQKTLMVHHDKAVENYRIDQGAWPAGGDALAGPERRNDDWRWQR